MADLAYNERIKLTANALDRASTACPTVGAIAPLATLVYANGAMPLSGGILVLAGISWFLAAAALHLFARDLLGRLRE